MRGGGTSVGHSQPRTLSRKKTLKKCKNKGGPDNVVVIDVDSDSLGNVIIIDASESLPTKVRGSSSSAPGKGKNVLSRTIICIDDDDDTESNHSAMGVVDDDSFYGDSFPSMRTFPASNYTSNRYGLSTESESISSDDDNYGPDLEFEGSSGKLKEQWVKAYLKRKKDFCTRVDQATTFSSQDVGTENKAETHIDDWDNPDSSGVSYENVDGSPSIATESGNLGKNSSGERLPPDSDGHGPEFKFQGYHRNLKEKWEKASFNGKNNVHNNQSGTSDQASSSASHFCTDSDQNFGSGNMNEGNGSRGKKNDVCNSHSDQVNNDPNDFTDCHQDVGILEDARDVLLHAQDDDAMPAAQSSLITEREMLKETDEYKRAIEEEWASRQRALQIQAEEAQHLRRLLKRKKAESMRLLDMERRQKQRLEEIRENQKKDEENMNLKEQLRTEVRKELSMLELTCSDMASVLRGLGIPVNGGLHPLSDEVRAAYKRALLSFHPDRAPQSDIRQQVEAEEKFKLMSRMKDKFLSS